MSHIGNTPDLYWKAKIRLFRTYKNTANTGEINTRKKSERPKKQRILGYGCGGLDWGKCLESGTNTRRSADVWKIHKGSNVRKWISEREEWCERCAIVSERLISRRTYIDMGRCSQGIQPVSSIHPPLAPSQCGWGTLRGRSSASHQTTDRKQNHVRRSRF